MASTVQLLTTMQMNDYVTRMPIDYLEAFRRLILVFFLVIIVTANAYDYSK